MSKSSYPTFHNISNPFLVLKKKRKTHTDRVWTPRPAAVVAAIKAVQLLQDLPRLLGGGGIVQVDQADARLHLRSSG